MTWTLLKPSLVINKHPIMIGPIGASEDDEEKELHGCCGKRIDLPLRLRYLKGSRCAMTAANERPAELSHPLRSARGTLFHLDE
jgi:hypothetical protein